MSPNSRVEEALARTFPSPEARERLDRLSRTWRAEQLGSARPQGAPGSRNGRRRRGQHRDADKTDAVPVAGFPAEPLEPAVRPNAAESAQPVAEQETLPCADDELLSDLNIDTSELGTTTAQPADRGESLSSNALRLLSVNDLRDLPEPRWLVAGLLPEGLIVLFGASGTGKSFLGLSWGLHIAAGRPWFDREVEPGTVVYVYAEGASGLKRRIPMLMKHAGIVGQTPDGRMLPFRMVPHAIALGPDVGEDDVDRLVKQIADDVRDRGLLPVRLLVIDTLNRCLQGDENNTPDMSAFVQLVDRLRRSLGCSALVIHHSGWDDTRERGSSVLRASADVVLSLKEDKRAKDQPRKLLLSCALKPPRDGDPFADVQLALLPVPVMDGQGNAQLDADGRPVTSCVVIELDTTAREAQRQVATAALRDAILRHVAANPGCLKTKAARAVRGKAETKLAVIEELVADGRLRRDASGALFAGTSAAPLHPPAFPVPGLVGPGNLGNSHGEGPLAWESAGTVKTSRSRNAVR